MKKYRFALPPGPGRIRAQECKPLGRKPQIGGASDLQVVKFADLWLTRHHGGSLVEHLAKQMQLALHRVLDVLGKDRDDG